MKYLVLIISILSLSLPSYGQIKSIKQVVYFIGVNSNDELFFSNTPNDSTIHILERFDKQGNMIYEQDFPADRLWREYGAWEHDYLYDKHGRVLKHQEYYHSEKKEMVLMNDFFYSYPNIDEPFIGNEIAVSYYFRESEPKLREQIDTVSIKPINTKDLYVSDLKSWWEYDTIRYDYGSFVVREDFSHNKNLLDINQFIQLLKCESIKGFENELKNGIEKLSRYLKQLKLSGTSNFCKFSIIKKDSPSSIGFNVSKNVIEIFYQEYDKKGNNTKTLSYNYYINGNELSKNSIIKTYIKYY